MFEFDLEDFRQIINWSHVSRLIIKTRNKDRNGIRSDHIPRKHITRLGKLFEEKIPEIWPKHLADVMDQMDEKKRLKKSG